MTEQETILALWAALNLASELAAELAWNCQDHTYHQAQVIKLMEEMEALTI